jgi:hypothetical protein
MEARYAAPRNIEQGLDSGNICSSKRAKIVRYSQLICPVYTQDDLLSLKSASTNSQKRCPMAMWHSWILAVLVEGIVMATSACWASVPPSFPVNPIVLRLRFLACFTPSNTLAELPLVLMATATSPGRPKCLYLSGEYLLKPVIVPYCSKNRRIGR